MPPTSATLYNNKGRQYDGDTKDTGLSSEGQSIKGRFEE